MHMRSINPTTEELLAEFEGISFEEALRRGERGKKAQISWRALTVEKRCEYIKNLAPVLRKSLLEYATLMTKEMGKPLLQAKAEIEKCAWLSEYYAEHAATLLAPEIIKTDAKKSYVRFDPLGVVLTIMPWNFPFWQVIRCAVPALAAGNTVLLKHASNVPQCALALEKIFWEAGFPEGVFQTLLIDSNMAGKLIESEFVDAVSLTGSTQAGSSTAALAGKHLKKCVLELGGSDPFIILADADLELACKTAVQARTINTGQSCIAAKRFFIEKSVYAECEKKIVEYFGQLKMGDPMDESVTIGPLAKADLCEALEKQLDDAVSKGAKVLAGSAQKTEKGKGFFFTPTLLTNVSNTMAVYTEETFGPLMILIPIEDAEEAICLANASEFGLGAALWSKDIELAERLAARIESGCVTINSLVKSDPRLPFGGVKKSGFGREMGEYGLKEFVNIKTVVV